MDYNEKTEESLKKAKENVERLYSEYISNPSPEIGRELSIWEQKYEAIQNRGKPLKPTEHWILQHQSANTFDNKNRYRTTI